MEIDFTELETFEKQLNEKRKTNNVVNSTKTSKPMTEQTIDELDEYLDRLTLDKIDVNKACGSGTMSTCKNDGNESSTMMPSQYLCDTVADNNTSGIINKISNSLPFPMLLLGFLSILAFVNSVNCKK